VVDISRWIGRLDIGGLRCACPPYESGSRRWPAGFSIVSDYRRCFVPGGCYFFTVVTYQRKPVFAEGARVELLREALRAVRRQRPFEIQAMVVMPEHLHAVWQLPKGDSDYSRRWREIKHFVSSRLISGTCGWSDGYRGGWRERVGGDDRSLQSPRYAGSLDYVASTPRRTAPGELD
jgi:REP element-mobilizing transposase RayT